MMRFGPLRFLLLVKVAKCWAFLPVLSTSLRNGKRKMVGGSPLLRYLKRAKRTANAATDGQTVWFMFLFVCASVSAFEFVCEES